MVGIAIIIQNIGGKLTSISLYNSIIMFDVWVFLEKASMEELRFILGAAPPTGDTSGAQVHSLLSVRLLLRFPDNLWPRSCCLSQPPPPHPYRETRLLI